MQEGQRRQLKYPETINYLLKLRRLAVLNSTEINKSIQNKMSSFYSLQKIEQKSLVDDMKSIKWCRKLQRDQDLPHKVITPQEY